jgi:DNA adenine methylase
MRVYELTFFNRTKTDSLPLYTRTSPKMLRYAGGKSRAVKQLQAYLPDEPIVAPFLGGGSVELAHAKTHRVIANDVCEPLINYWRTLQVDCDNLQASLSTYPPSKEIYTAFKSSLDEGTELERATKFYYVNRCCFSGCMTGGFSGARFTPSCIAKLSSVNLTNIEFHNQDYETFLNAYPTHFAYLDPPYDVPNLYLSTSFDHERLATLLHARKSKWILCYNDTPRIRALYADCTIIPVSWAYGMNASRKSNEVIILPKTETRVDRA